MGHNTCRSMGRVLCVVRRQQLGMNRGRANYRKARAACMRAS